MQPEQVLAEFQDTGALLHGHFELRSGLHSDQYFQCALVLQHPRVAERLCAALAGKVPERLGAGYRPGAVISPALGGIPVGHELGRAFGVRAIFAEKQEGRLVLRRAFEVRPGEHFLVAEDVVTRGGRVHEVMNIVRERGGIVDGIAVLVDRSAGHFACERPVISLLQLAPVTWSPGECPLCRKGESLAHPGS